MPLLAVAGVGVVGALTLETSGNGISLVPLRMPTTSVSCNCGCKQLPCGCQTLHSLLPHPILMAPKTLKLKYFEPFVVA